MLRGLAWLLLLILVAAAGAAAGWIGHSLLTAANVPTVAIYDDWRLACPAPSQATGSCMLVQDLVDRNTQRPVAHLTISELKTGRILIATVPFNVVLGSGLGVGIGKDKMRVYRYRTCDKAGCIAQIPADDALMVSLRGAPNARLLFVGPDNKTISLPFSLKGFPGAYAGFTAQQKRRRSWWMTTWP
jgi:invasion protein IalB